MFSAIHIKVIFYLHLHGWDCVWVTNGCYCCCYCAQCFLESPRQPPKKRAKKVSRAKQMAADMRQLSAEKDREFHEKENLRIQEQRQYEERVRKEAMEREREAMEQADDHVERDAERPEQSVEGTDEPHAPAYTIIASVLTTSPAPRIPILSQHQLHLKSHRVQAHRGSTSQRRTWSSALRPHPLLSTLITTADFGLQFYSSCWCWTFFYLVQFLYHCNWIFFSLLIPCAILRLVCFWHNLFNENKNHHWWSAMILYKHSG